MILWFRMMMKYTINQFKVLTLSVCQTLYQGLSTYKTKDMMRYIINQFKVLGKEAKEPEHYHQHRLGNEMMPRIIALGLDRQPMERRYKRSRAGQKLFNKIHTIVTTLRSVKMFKPHLTTDNLVPITRSHHQYKNFTFSHINARSIHNKIPQFQLHLTQKDVDMCAITETWIKSNGSDDLTVKQIPHPVYKISSFPRNDGWGGGGLALVMKDYIYVIESMEYTVTTSMEWAHTNIKVNNTCICLYIIYRIPNTSVLLFCEELAQLFEKYFLTDTQNTVLLGDLNIHMDDLQHPDTIMFNDFLDSFNLKNHVSFPTHTSKHHLCITDNTTNLVSRVTQGHALSDHNFIHVSLEISKPTPPIAKTTYRKLVKIDHDQFREDIWWDLDVVKDLPDLEEKIEKYNTVFKTVLGKHAPLVTQDLKEMP